MHWEIRDRLDAAAFALGAFAIPYLAAGLRRFAGHNWWWVLVWPQEAGPLWGPLGFELGGFAVVALLVYHLRLQRLWYTKRIVPPWFIGTPLDRALEANAVLTALAVFLVPYLTLGLGLGGFRNWDWMSLLLWPLDIWENFTRFVLFVLAALAAVSLFVLVLKLNYLSACKQYETLKLTSSPRPLLGMPFEFGQKEVAEPRADAGGASPDSELAALRDQVKALRDNLDSSARRAAEAEAKLRKMEQTAGGSPASGGAAAGRGGDAKFKLAKRAFARIVHPDSVQKDGVEKKIRAAIYKELSRELEAIEKG